MRKLLYFLLLCLPLSAAARDLPGMVRLSADSFNYHLSEKKWRFHAGDDTAWAAPGFNDSSWQTDYPKLMIGNDTRHRRFGGICWFRLHFFADTTITDMPLALRMTQYGASEIYLDGRLVKILGRIKNSTGSIYYNPQGTPFIIQLPRAGDHVLAVRYANYNALHNFTTYNKELGGFMMTIGDGDANINALHNQTISLTFVMILMFGIFVAIALLHFILFLYYRSQPSNLYFSVFSLCLACLFLLPYLGRISTTPSFQLKAGYILPVVISIACFSLSGFTNKLFGRSQLRFRIVAGACLLAILIRPLHLGIAIAANLALVGIVSLEAIILIIRAIRKKVKGAKIIGSGILSFAFFLLILMLCVTGFGFDLDDSTNTGRIIELLLAVAILCIPVSMSAYLAWSFAGINRDLGRQLEQVQLLSEKTLQQEQEKKRMLENRKEELEQEVAVRTTEVMAQKDKIEKQHEELKTEKKKSDDLLLNILPAEVAEELKEKGYAEARLYDNVSVLFTDFVDFTKLAEVLSPSALVAEIDTCFKAFDEIVTRHGLEKIKTIGDAYLAVSGLPGADSQHALHTTSAALEIRDFMTNRVKSHNSFAVRIGIHSGSVVAGIVGIKKFAYDIWGDTVNTAARMEQSGEPGKVNVSQTSYELVKDSFECSYRGEIPAKNKGNLRMYFAERRKNDIRI